MPADAALAGALGAAGQAGPAGGDEADGFAVGLVELDVVADGVGGEVEVGLEEDVLEVLGGAGDARLLEKGVERTRRREEGRGVGEQAVGAGAGGAEVLAGVEVVGDLGDVGGVGERRPGAEDALGEVV